MLGTLTRKIIIGGVGLLLCVALAAVMVITNVQRIRTATDHLSHKTVEQVELSGQFNTHLLRMITETDSYARTHDPADREYALQELHDAGIILNQLGALSGITDSFHSQMYADQM